MTGLIEFNMPPATNKILKACYYVCVVTALGMNLSCVSSTTALSVFGTSLALRWVFLLAPQLPDMPVPTLISLSCWFQGSGRVNGARSGRHVPRAQPDLCHFWRRVVEYHFRRHLCRHHHNVRPHGAIVCTQLEVRFPVAVVTSVALGARRDPEVAVAAVAILLFCGHRIYQQGVAAAGK